MLYRLIVILALIFSSTSFANEKRRNIIYAGGTVGGNNITVSNTKEKEEASLVTKTKFNGTVGYTTLPRPLWASIPWLRSTLEFSVASFNTTLQPVKRIKLEKEEKGQSGFDLGTGINGFLGYVNPTLLIHHSLTDIIYLNYGIGVGLGYASLSGNYFQTDGNVSAGCSSAVTTADVAAQCEKIKMSAHQFGVAMNLIANLSLGWFGIRVDSGGFSFNSNSKSYYASRANATLYLQHHF